MDSCDFFLPGSSYLKLFSVCAKYRKTVMKPAPALQPYFKYPKIAQLTFTKTQMVTYFLIIFLKKLKKSITITITRQGRPR